MKYLAAAGGVLVLGLVAACSSSPGAQPTSGIAQAAAGSSYYVASGSSSVTLITWNSSGTGTYTFDTINSSGSDPSAPYSLGVTTVPITVTINSNQVAITLSGVLSSIALNGTMNGDGSLTITAPPDSSTGQIQSGTLTRSDPGTYNQDVTALDNTISHDNQQAAQAYAAQQQAQAQQSASSATAAQQAQDQQTASNDASQLGTDVQSAQTDLQSMGTDVQSTATDLQSLKNDASQGAGTGPGDCSNMSTISSDASSTLASDLTSTIASDVSTLQGDLSTVAKDISAVQSDIQTLQSDGLSIPAAVSGAIGPAQSAVGGIKQGANSDIATAAGYVDQGYSIANSLATGACAGMGPGSPPSPPGGF